MLYFLLAISQSISILIVFKFFNRYGIRNTPAILVNYICAAFLSFAFSSGEMAAVDYVKDDFFIYTIIIGVIFLAGFYTFALSTQRAGLAITSVASNISIFIPVGFALLFYGEQLNILKTIGLLLTFPALYLVFKKNGNDRLNLKIIVFPILLFFINGTNSTLLKHAETNGARENHMTFLMFIFIFAFITGTTHYLLSNKKQNLIHAPSILAGVLLGVLNFGSTYYFIKAMSFYESSIFFPVYNLSFISIAAVLGYLMFKEKLSPINITGVALAIASIFLISYS